MKIEIPELCLVALVGPSGSGKSSFGKKYFKPTEVVSSDFCRGLVSDDENDQSATAEAFDLLYQIAGKRLTAGKLTVVDATNVQAEDRKKIVNAARAHDCLAVAIVFDLPERLCHERNASRGDRAFGPHVVRNQHSSMRRSLRNLEREGFRYVYVLKSEEQVNNVEIVRNSMFNDKRNEHGPFDIIGDIHGCYDELTSLLSKLGYEKDATISDAPNFKHPDGRKALFLGDLVDRGPKVPEVLELVMNMVESQNALCVPGNHDIKLMKKLHGRDVRITHGLQESLEQLEDKTPEFKQKTAKFIEKLISHFVLDDGKLVVAHAGMKQSYQGRASGRVRDFALFGETTGETDDFGYPVRYNWAKDYRGEAMVVYGHTSVKEPEWLNRTVCIDTGCVYGGKLTALRYPEKEFVSVDAAAVYYESSKPFLDAEPESTQQTEERAADMLDINDVMGKRVIFTRLQRNITVREENSNAAIEVMSRFAVNPKWLIYLPPTMSPCETSKDPLLLEHPAEALNYYANVGISKVVCEQKHMGSRAIVIICKDEDVVFKRFGIKNDGIGICYTRTGRRFFSDQNVEKQFLQRIHHAITEAGFWEEFDTNWFAFDSELMPWSAKAQELVRDQYAAVGCAATVSLSSAIALLTKATELNADNQTLLEKYQAREKSIAKYRDAYRVYCWPVNSLDDIKLAPFHLLATDKKTYLDKDNQWHMETLAKLSATSNGLIMATPFKVIDLQNQESFDEAVRWWFELTESGGEGMVVKPFDFIASNEKGLLQPAIKCRGRDYLRIIYGPEYTAEEHLQRLRHRGLSSKRSLAIREFALGVEGLERFVNHEPLYKVHECVSAVLALESEPVDARL